MKTIKTAIFLAFLLIPSLSWGQSTEGKLSSELPNSNVVKAIEVEGQKTISLATILSKIKTRVGQEYLETVVSDDLKRLYNTGYFSDVSVDRQDYPGGGIKLVLHVLEKPIVEELTFSKIRLFNPRVLGKKLKTQLGQFLDNKFLKDDIQTIQDLYNQKGLTDAQVDVETFIDQVTNKAKLHFVIKEGYRVRIKRIYFTGNSSFAANRLKRVIKTRPKWSFIQSGYLKKDVLTEDVERVKSFYEQNGFIDAKVDYETKELGQGFMDIHFNLSEGKKYFVGKIIVEGNHIVTSEQISEAMKETKQNGVFSREKFSVDLSKIRTLYFDRGYIFADVAEATSLDSQTGTVDVKVTIEEGEPAYVRKVKVQGNTRTRDIVIRRELKVLPGEQFDGAKLRRSKERLDNLGYFEDVNFDIEDTDVHDKKDLVVQVKEAKTGTLSFGGGFSTVDKVVGFVELEQKNFDITNWPTFTGGGQHLSFRAETGSTKNNLYLTFLEPWLFDYPISFGADAYKTQHDRQSDTGRAYDENRLGGVLHLGKQFSEYVSGEISYKNEKVRIENFESGVSADLLAEEGTNQVSVLGLTLERDTRDSTYNPQKGWLLNGGFDLAGGPLGADKDFYRTQLSTNYYIPLKFESVVELRARVGFVDAYGNSQKVPIFERFFAGGAYTIRGYDERGVGPLDSATNDPIGGESLFVANVEYTIPLIDFVKLAAFFDTGNVWPSVGDFGTEELKSGFGAGLRVKTPIGPISLDYGYPLNDEPGKQDRSGKFYFSVSRGF